MTQQTDPQNQLAIENDTLREDIHARDAKIFDLQRQLACAQISHPLGVVSLLTAAGRNQVEWLVVAARQRQRIDHLERDAGEDSIAIGALTRELAEERKWSSYYHDISDALAGELQRIDVMLAGVGFEAQGEESIADRVARLIGATLPSAWGINEESALYVPALIAEQQDTHQ